MSSGWEDRAHNWIEWARRPKFDALSGIPADLPGGGSPSAGEATLEIGCGEGRVTRDMAARGHAVTAIDASPTLVASAAAMDGHSLYKVAHAEYLPFDDSSFDVVVAYNSLMDVQDMPLAVREASRVLRRNSYMAVCVTHPVCDAGTFTDFTSSAPFIIEETYRGARLFHAIVERDGLRMDFEGHTYDLESYVCVFEQAGLLMERLREPAPGSSVSVCISQGSIVVAEFPTFSCYDSSNRSL